VLRVGPPRKEGRKGEGKKKKQRFSSKADNNNLKNKETQENQKGLPSSEVLTTTDKASTNLLPSFPLTVHHLFFSWLNLNFFLPDFCIGL
jgi:hypothetical protein